ncbi:MAG: FG-GAP repeat protein, partial [Candidatus Thermoplasmatota archaeon]|nr:FG-GAP repeat protein [Candidatus Thermoplasmatota archaeon]
MRRFGAILVSVLLIASVLAIMKNDLETFAMNGTPIRYEDWTMDMNVSEASLGSFIGEATDDHSGWSVSGAGDVNGDGYDDILIGATWNNEGGSHTGQTYLIMGKNSGWSMDISLSLADASFIGEAANDWSGFSVSGAGDVNGDGYDDILIGAFYNGAGGNHAGQTYLIMGKNSGWSMDTSLGSADASFIGEAADDELGRSVSGAGDVNGDGYDDILIGAPLNDEGGSKAGQTYLVLGKASGWSLDANLSQVDASFWGEVADDELGRSVSGAGDVNGDGYDDILIGAYKNAEGGIYTGQTYLIMGKASGWSMDTSLGSADASFIGEAGGDQSGWSVSGAGDVDGDGYDDILIGANKNAEGGSFAGQTYLIMGKASGWSMDTSLSLADASFIG